MADYGPFAPAQIDFSWLTELPEQYEKGSLYGRQRKLRGVLGTDEAKAALEAGDYGKLASMVAQFDPKYAADLAGSGDADRFFGTPIWGTVGTGENAREAVGAFTKQGRFEQLDTGEFQPTRGVTIEDYDTYRRPQSKTTGAPVGPDTPRNIIDRESQQAQGKMAGENISDLPNVVSRAEESVRSIDLALEHPGRETATGPSGWADPRSWLGGTEATSYREGQMKQVSGQAFLGNIQQMRGLGHLSDAEGAAATQAATSLGTRQSDADHEMALRDLKAFHLRGLVRAYTKVGREVPRDMLGAWQQAEAQSNKAKSIPFQAAVQQGVTPPMAPGARRVPTMNVSPDGTMAPTQPGPPVTTDTPRIQKGSPEERELLNWANKSIKEAADRGVDIRAQVIERLRGLGVGP